MPKGGSSGGGAGKGGKNRRSSGKYRESKGRSTREKSHDRVAMDKRNEAARERSRRKREGYGVF